MTRRRAVFLDVDGTYAHRGVVPAGHAAAVRTARAAGHLVFLCTGRPKAMLPQRLLGAGFDGLVAGGGSYAEVDGAVLADRRFPAGPARRLVTVLNSHDVAYLLEAPDAIHGPPGVDRRLRGLLAGHLGLGTRTVTGPRAEHDGPADVLTALTMSGDLTGASFGKVTCFDSPVPIPDLAAEIGPEVSALPNSVPGLGGSAGELHLTGVHKALGIQVVTQHLGIDRADVVAVGDGMNDVEMLDFAGTGVAIEGADPRVLAVADLVAPGPVAEGLVGVFASLGLT